MDVQARKPLRALVPGDQITGIDELRLVGPRGGRYVFRGMTSRSGCPMQFTHSTLSPDGRDRTFHFTDGHPLTVSSALSCKLRARMA